MVHSGVHYDWNNINLVPGQRQHFNYNNCELKIFKTTLSSTKRINRQRLGKNLLECEEILAKFLDTNTHI